MATKRIVGWGVVVIICAGIVAYHAFYSTKKNPSSVPVASNPTSVVPDPSPGKEGVDSPSDRSQTSQTLQESAADWNKEAAGNIDKMLKSTVVSPGALIFPEKSPTFGERINPPKSYLMTMTLQQSPDGKRLLFLYRDPEKDHRNVLMLRDLNTGAETVLMEETRSDNPSVSVSSIERFEWLPSGDAIVYSNRVVDSSKSEDRPDFSYTLHVYDIQSQTSRPIGEKMNTEPCIAGFQNGEVVLVRPESQPDGHSYQVDRVSLNEDKKQRTIGVLPLSSNEETRVQVRCESPQLQPNSDLLYFIVKTIDFGNYERDRTLKVDFKLASASIRNPAQSYQIITLPSGPEKPITFRWNTDGRFLAVSGEGVGLIVYRSVQGQFSEVRKFDSTGVSIESFCKDQLVFLGTDPNAVPSKDMSEVYRQVPYQLSVKE